MEMYHVIRAPMMSWTSEKKSRMINSSPQERDAKIGLGKKRFPFGITTAGARGSFAPRDLMLSVKLTKLVWKKKKVRLHLFIPFHFTAHLPSAYLDPSFLFLRIFFSLPPSFLAFFFFDADGGAWCQLCPYRVPAFLICIVTFSNYRIYHKGPRRRRW